MKLAQKTLVWSMNLTIALSSMILMQLEVDAQSSIRVAQGRGISSVVYVHRKLTGSAPGGNYGSGGSRTAKPIGANNPPRTATCSNDFSLTALVPFEATYRQVEERECPPVLIPSQRNVWAYTASDRPTFWVHTAYANPALPAEFSIDDEDAGQTIYSTPVTLPKQPGILGIRLPQSVTLKPDKRYRWIFKVVIPSNEPNNIAGTEAHFVEAVVVRDALPADVVSQLTPNPSVQNAIIYAKNGFWHDALTTLVEQRQQRPQDQQVTQAWRELLSGVAATEEGRRHFNVDKISSQPIVK